MSVRHPAALFGLVLLAACASDVPVVPQQELQQARAQGRLETVYSRLDSDLKRDDLSKKSQAQLLAQKQQIGSELAQARVSDIQTTLSAYDGLAPLSVLDDAEKRLAPVQQWDSARFAAARTDLQNRRQRTQSAIDERQLVVASLGSDQAAHKLSLLDELVKLSGGVQAEAFQAQKRSYVDELYRLAGEAIARAQFVEAEQLLTPVATFDANYKDIRSLQLQVNASLFEKHFWEALGRGSPDEAYRLFLELAESPGFDLVRGQVSGAATELAKYFSVLGDKQRKQGDLAPAFQSFRYAASIRQRLGEASYGAEETAFIKQLDTLFSQAEKTGQTVLAYGYLLALETLDPNHATVRRNLRSVRETMLAEARIKLAAMPMSNANTERAYGSGLASKVTQHLLAQIPDDVAVIERAQFDSIVAASKRDTAAYPSHYYVQGEILESGVDSTEKSVNRQVRVVTEQVPTPNPDHAAWLKLSNSERRKTPEPPATVAVPKREDVTIRSTAIRKVGVFSVTFRLVDPFSSKVLFVDSLTEKATHEGETVEGMEIGEFRQEAKTASLPSDSEVLDALAEEVAKQVGDRLIAELKNPELRYREYAQRALGEDQLRAAAINFGYATALSEHKQAEDVAELRENFLFNLMRVR